GVAVFVTVLFEISRKTRRTSKSQRAVKQDIARHTRRRGRETRIGSQIRDTALVHSRVGQNRSQGYSGIWRGDQTGNAESPHSSRVYTGTETRQHTGKVITALKHVSAKRQAMTRV